MLVQKKPKSPIKPKKPTGLGFFKKPGFFLNPDSHSYYYTHQLPLPCLTKSTQSLNHTSSRKSSRLFGLVEGVGKYPKIALRRTTEFSFFRRVTRARRARDMNLGSFVDTALSICLICCLISKMHQLFLSKLLTHYHVVCLLHNM